MMHMATMCNMHSSMHPLYLYMNVHQYSRLCSLPGSSGVADDPDIHSKQTPKTGHHGSRQLR